MTIYLSRLLLLVCLAFSSVFFAQTAGAKDIKRVGMALWAGCEDVCAGVRDQLAAADPMIEFVLFDAGRDLSTLASIPDKAKAAELDVILTWGTRVTREVAGTISEFGKGSRMGEIPVVFTVVADPVGADIIESHEATGRLQITGTRNRVPEMVNIRGLQRVMPDFNHLGLLYEPDEENSRLKYEELRVLADRMGFSLTASSLSGTDEEKLLQMYSALAEMQNQAVQFLYLGSSTFLEVHADAFTQAAVGFGLPVLSPYENLVHDSEAYISIAARDYDVGMLAGRRALEVLAADGPAGQFPIVAMEEFAFVLNSNVAEKLNLFPPIEVMQFLEVVSD